MDEHTLTKEEEEALKDLFRFLGKIARDDSYWSDDQKLATKEDVDA